METTDKFYYDYVVWSLNRTMQYGNNSGKTLDTSPDIGLNRTMQYGNISSEYMNI